MSDYQAEDIYAKIALRIRRLRLAQDLAMEELAERAGITSSYLGQIERGERKLSLRSLAAIAEGLRTEPHSLLQDGSDDTDPSGTLEQRLLTAVSSASEADREAALKTLKLLLRILRRRRKRA